MIRYDALVAISSKPPTMHHAQRVLIVPGLADCGRAGVGGHTLAAASLWLWLHLILYKTNHSLIMNTTPPVDCSMLLMNPMLISSYGGFHMINKSTHKKDVFDYSVDEEKFWSKVKIGTDDDCWLWQGAKNTTGYGLFSVRNCEKQWEKTGRSFTHVLAHRLSAAMHKDVEQHDYVMHKCDNRACCNPRHLQVGTALDNFLDMVAKGRWNGREKMNNP